MWIEILRSGMTFLASILLNNLGLITAIFLFGSLFITFLQLRSTQRSSKAQYGINIMQELRTKEWRNRLHSIYHSNYNTLKGTELEFEAEYTLDRLEWVGIMLKKKVFPLDLVMMLIGGLPVRVWYKLSRLVDDKRGERGHYARYAEFFAKISLKYQIERYPMEEWTRLGDIEIFSDLISKAKLISIPLLRWINLKRWFRARGKNLNHRHVFSLDADTKPSKNFFENAVINDEVEKISKIFSDENINLKNIKASQLCYNKWLIKGKENGKKGRYVLLSTENELDVYDCNGYKKWYREINMG